MSHDYDALYREIDELRRMGDELRLKAHLGRMDARELWDDLEKRWNHLEANAKQLTRESEDALAGALDVVRDTITELHEGYDRLASTLRETRPDSLWGQVRNTFDGFVEGGHRVTVSTSSVRSRNLETLPRLGWRMRASSGTSSRNAPSWERACTSWRRDRFPTGGRRRYWTTTKVKALLQEVGALDADFQKAAAELSKPDRAEA